MVQLVDRETDLKTKPYTTLYIGTICCVLEHFQRLKSRLSQKKKKSFNPTLYTVANMRTLFVLLHTADNTLMQNGLSAKVIDAHVIISSKSVEL